MATDYRIKALLSGSKWSGSTITYSFFDGRKKNLSELTPAIKDNVRNILENIIEPLINVNFVEVADRGNGGLLRYMFDTKVKSGGYAYYPQPPFLPFGGDVHLSPNNASDFADTISYGFETLIHETLHALGLKHPGNYNGNGSGDPPFLSYGEDNNTNTVMTYNSVGSPSSTPMPYDILALQHLYGARSYRADNTTYTFNTVYRFSDGVRSWGSTTRQTKITIWDSGGVDTLNLSPLAFNSSGYRLDMRPGGLLTASSAYKAAKYYARDNSLPGDYTSERYSTSAYGTAIAYNVTLENLIGSSSSDLIFGNEANNDLRSGGGYDAIYGNGGNDTIASGTGNDTIDGGNGNDIIGGEEGDDLVLGGAGNDALSDGIGNNTLSGGTGDDSYFVNSLGDLVVENPNEGNDTVVTSLSYTLGANVENLTLFGLGNVNGTGNSANNLILGNSGNNILDGKAGNDTLEGREGNDTYIVDSIADVIIENPGQGIDTVIFSINYALGANLENFILTGTDNLNVTGNSGDNLLTGNSSNNILIAGDGNDTLNGGAGNDNLYGEVGNKDLLFGEDGNDTITDLDGVNVADGGAGNDRLDITFAAAWDNDTKSSTAPRSDGRIIGGYGDDEIIVTMNKAGFFINMKGDQPVSNHPLDGNDLITLVGTYSNSVVDLGGGNDIFNGGIGNDNVSGSSGDDTITGAGGGDRLVGGTGYDLLTGGRGGDHFVFDTMTAFATPEIGVDTIVDFSISEGDKIVLDKTTFRALTSIARKTPGFSNSHEFAVVNDDIAASISQAAIIYNSSNGGLFYNPNANEPGLGGGELFAKLTGFPLLAATDFIIQG